jgi:hypothetical protein
MKKLSKEIVRGLNDVKKNSQTQIRQKMDNIKGLSRKDIKEKVDTHKKVIIRISDYTIAHIWRSVITLIIIILITIIASLINKPLFLIFSTILAIYAFIIALSLFRRGLKYLFNNQGNVYELIIGYAIAVLVIIFFFTTIYSISEELNTGYLTYGKCSEMAVNSTMILNDPNAVKSFSGKFYFSGVTFFTIGFGDMCPMGSDKGISLLNGFFGSVFATIIIAIAIARYIEKDMDKK